MSLPGPIPRLHGRRTAFYLGPRRPRLSFRDVGAASLWRGMRQRPRRCQDGRRAVLDAPRGTGPVRRAGRRALSDTCTCILLAQPGRRSIFTPRPRFSSRSISNPRPPPPSHPPRSFAFLLIDQSSFPAARNPPCSSVHAGFAGILGGDAKSDEPRLKEATTRPAGASSSFFVPKYPSLRPPSVPSTSNLRDSPCSPSTQCPDMQL